MQERNWLLYAAMVHLKCTRHLILGAILPRASRSGWMAKIIGFLGSMISSDSLGSTIAAAHIRERASGGTTDCPCHLVKRIILSEQNSQLFGWVFMRSSAPPPRRLSGAKGDGDAGCTRPRRHPTINRSLVAAAALVARVSTAPTLSCGGGGAGGLRRRRNHPFFPRQVATEALVALVPAATEAEIGDKERRRP